MLCANRAGAVPEAKARTLDVRDHGAPGESGIEAQFIGLQRRLPQAVRRL